MTSIQLKARIERLAPGTTAEVTDLTGTMDHYQAVVVSPVFAGKMMIEQHQLVYGLFKDEIQSNEVHALSLRTFTPEQFNKQR